MRTGDVKRFAMDDGVPRKRKVTPPKQWYSERVSIVGAGRTGLSAAYYLARRGYRVTVYDAMPVAGGMMSIGIPDYRLPRAELHRDIGAMRGLGGEIILDTAGWTGHAPPCTLKRIYREVRVSR